MANYPGVTVSKNNFCGLLKKAWDKSFTTNNITSVFRACEIIRYNPEAIPKEAYLPNSLHSIKTNNKPTESDLPLAVPSGIMASCSQIQILQLKILLFQKGLAVSYHVSLLIYKIITSKLILQ